MMVLHQTLHRRTIRSEASTWTRANGITNSQWRGLPLYFTNPWGAFQLISRQPIQPRSIYGNSDDPRFLLAQARSSVLNGRATSKMLGVPAIGALFRTFTPFKMSRERLFGERY